MKNDIEILFENEDFLVINKPPGLTVHPDGRTPEFVLTDWIKERYPETKEVGEPIKMDNGTTIDRPGIVHRLDKETSGALIVVKNTPSYKYFKRQFKKRKIAKRYNAFVYGRLKKDRDIIDRSIGRSKKDFRKRSAGKDARGKNRSARTIYKTNYATDRASYVDVFPKTGRTHQIRVHLRSIHHPIVCDSLYAKDKKCILGFDRLALHARELRFFLPGQQKQLIAVEAPLPDDFEKGLSKLKEGR